MKRATELSNRLAPAVGLLLFLATAWPVLQPCQARADTPPSTEYQVKAACLLNFVQFIKWPDATFAEPNSPMLVGVLGDDPFGAALEQTFEDESPGGRKLVVRRSKHVEDLKTCHLIFISRSEKESLSVILQSLNNVSVVTVSEMDEFAHRGGIINFYIEDKKVRFEINVGAAEAKALKISAQLLKRARIVG